jgi:hypothetical protein
MAVVMLIGADAPLLEGLSQALVAAGHRPRSARTVEDAIELSAHEPPLVAVVDRALAAYDVRTLRLPLAAGGALVLYRDAASPEVPLSPAFGRAALADLTLPLERHRLVLLVGKVAARAEATGRGQRDTPPEHHLR